MTKHVLAMCALALWAVACGGPVEPQAQGNQGKVELPLTATASDGRTYRLASARFIIEGSDHAPVVLDETQTQADTASVALAAGDYTVYLDGPWFLESTQQPGVAVATRLVSPNPMMFSVVENGTSSVRFRFKTPGEGTADVGITVDSGGWVTGRVSFDQPGYTVTEPLQSLMGRVVDYSLSFATAEFTRFTTIDGYKALGVLTGPVSVQFGSVQGSDVLLHRVAPSLDGQPLSFAIVARDGGDFEVRDLSLVGRPASESYALSMYWHFPAGALDADGYPAPAVFSTQDAWVNLSQFNSTGTLVGSVSGPGTAELAPQ